MRFRATRVPHFHFDRPVFRSGDTTPNYHLAKCHYAKYHLFKCNYAKLITPNAITPNAITPKRERYVRQYSNNSETHIASNVYTTLISYVNTVYTTSYLNTVYTLIRKYSSKYSIYYPHNGATKQKFNYHCVIEFGVIAFGVVAFGVSNLAKWYLA